MMYVGPLTKTLQILLLSRSRREASFTISIRGIVQIFSIADSQAQNYHVKQT